ncbi:Cytoplasmic polyadenylation element-binding protein 4 [Trichinella patagoniensis]|uniref:Cytoplasmic polyadenylation element-binding protein 4 n=1 Tax=Trichinella patagoniensis TaxID=990121 RepID=A0A0V0ZDD1_9BILA|nr:Cytoplasmic polyadenylation element-binding protein 4 [Trichinella patagoniensis]
MSKQNKKKIGKYQRKEQGLYDKVFESLMSAALDAAPKEPKMEFSSLWRPSQFLDRSIIEAAEKLSVSRKVFVRDLPIEWPESKVHDAFRRFGNLEISWFSGIVGRPSNECAYLLFEKEEDVKAMLASSRHVGDGYEVKLQDPPGEPRPVILEPWIITEGVCLEERDVLIDRNHCVMLSNLPLGLTAPMLAKLVDEKYPGVAYLAIQTDEVYNYPTGSARVFFDNKQSFEKCSQEGSTIFNFIRGPKRIDIRAYKEEFPYFVNFGKTEKGETSQKN